MFKLIFNLLLLGACAGIFFVPKFGISAKYDDIKVRKAEIKEYDNANKSARDLVAKRDDLNNRFNAFTPQEQSRLITFLPDNIDPIRYILEMEGIGKKLGMPIKGAGYTSAKIGGTPVLTAGASDVKYGVFNFTFTSEGSYSDLQRMLTEFDRSLRLIDIESIGITPAGGNGLDYKALDHYNFQIVLKTYWLK